METDSITYDTTNYCGKHVLIENLSIPEIQLLDKKYWDKELFFSIDSLQSQNETITVRPAENHDGIKPFFSLEQIDGIFSLLLLCFLLLAYIYKGGILFFKENLSFAFSTRKIVNQLNKTTASEFGYNFILIFQFVLLASISLFALFTKQDTTYIPPNSFLIILVFMLVIFLFGMGMFLFYKFVGYLFEIQDDIKMFIRGHLVVLEIVGLLAFIPVLLLVYSSYYHEVLIGFLIVLFVISRLIIIYKTGVFFFRQNVNFLFSIAYLCNVEIIPYFLLYGGLLHLFKIDIISLL
ncbi:DUF4271 domain-containing protein [Viscerimonas tarda]